MNSLTQLLEEVTRERFYGSVEIKFEAGKPVLVRKTETIKPTYAGGRDTRGQLDESDH